MAPKKPIPPAALLILEELLRERCSPQANQVTLVSADQPKMDYLAL